MSLVLTLRIRIGDDNMQNSLDVADALDGVAQRFRASGYVETVQDNSREQISRGILDGAGNTVGEWNLQDSPV